MRSRRACNAVLDEPTGALSTAEQVHYFTQLRRCGIDYLCVGHGSELPDDHARLFVVDVDSGTLRTVPHRAADADAMMDASLAKTTATAVAAGAAATASTAIAAAIVAEPATAIATLATAATATDVPVTVPTTTHAVSTISAADADADGAV